MTVRQSTAKRFRWPLFLAALASVLGACGEHPPPTEALDLETLTRRGVPVVVSSEPAPGATEVGTDAAIKLVFNLPMDTASVEGAFSLTPEVAGSFTWSPNAKEVTFTPSAPLAKGTDYTLVVGTEARTKGQGGGAGNKHLRVPYHLSFTTARSRWETQDVGDVGLPGAAGRDENGLFTVRGSGADIWNEADAFRYVYRPLSGDGELIARVTSLTNTDPYAKSGLMIRESLAPGSRHISVFVTPENGVVGQGRLETDGGSYAAPPNSRTLPQWLKLVREGDVFRSYASDDGEAWALIDEKTLELARDAYIGFAVTSHNNSRLATSTFDDIEIPGGGPDFPLPVEEPEPSDLPDLIVTDVTWAPGNPNTGDAVQLSAVIKNQGAAPTPEGVIIAPVFFVDGNFVGYTDTYKTSLAPGASVTVAMESGPNGATWTATEGSHEVSVLVDDINRIAESDEDNNWFYDPEALTVTTLDGPDLVVRNITWDGVLGAGGEVTFKATVQNQGRDPSPEGALHGVAFRVGEDVVASSGSYTATIEPGEEVTLTADGTWEAALGSFRVTATVDPEGRIAEARESNNDYAIDLLVAEPGTEAARAADALVESIGFAVHIRYIAGTPEYTDIVKPRLLESGVRYIRDGGQGERFYEHLNELAGYGIRSTMVMDPRDNLFPSNVVEDGILPIIDSVVAIEGPNEWDANPTLTYNGQTFPEGVRAYQNEMYEVVKNHPDPRVRAVDVLSPSLAQAQNSGTLGPVAADKGNLHSYQGGNEPTAGLDLWLSETRKIVGDKPMVATETGWHYQPSCAGQPGVSEEAGAKYSTRLYLDYFSAGVERTHLYNLQLDTSCWGLLRSDGTPYKAFYGIKNMIALLEDPGAAFSPGSLTYALSGNVTNLKRTVLEKRDGTRYLILWVNAKSYDTAQRRDIAVPEQQVSLEFDPSVGRVRAYLPTRSTDPVQTYSGSELSLGVPDEPLVLELLP